MTPPPGAFAQATAEGENALLQAATKALDGARRIAVLFAGCGTFSLPLAVRAEIHTVETDAAMLAAVDRGWRTAPGLKRVTNEARDLFRRPLLPEDLRYFDAILLDPARAGAKAQAAEIARDRLPIVDMIFRNPVTFARDARHLTEAGYRLDWVQVVNQFRWFAHVELAARFSLWRLGKSPGREVQFPQKPEEGQRQSI